MTWNQVFSPCPLMDSSLTMAYLVDYLDMNSLRRTIVWPVQSIYSIYSIYSIDPTYEEEAKALTTSHDSEIERNIQVERSTQRYNIKPVIWYLKLTALAVSGLYFNKSIRITSIRSLMHFFLYHLLSFCFSSKHLVRNFSCTSDDFWPPRISYLNIYSLSILDA